MKSIFKVIKQAEPQQVAGLIEKKAFSHKPQATACAEPVVTIIFTVAERSDYIIAAASVFDAFSDSANSSSRCPRFTTDICITLAAFDTAGNIKSLGQCLKLLNGAYIFKEFVALLCAFKSQYCLV